MNISALDKIDQSKCARLGADGFTLKIDDKTFAWNPPSSSQEKSKKPVPFHYPQGLPMAKEEVGQDNEWAELSLELFISSLFFTVPHPI